MSKTGVDGLAFNFRPTCDHAGDQNLNIGENLNRNANSLHYDSDEQTYDVIDHGIAARELKERGVITKHVQNVRSASGMLALQGEQQNDEKQVETPH